MGYWKRYLETDIWDPVPAEKAGKDCAFIPAIGEHRIKRGLKFKHRMRMFAGVAFFIMVAMWISAWPQTPWAAHRNAEVADPLTKGVLQFLAAGVMAILIPNLVLFFVNRIQSKYWFFFDPKRD